MVLDQLGLIGHDITYISALTDFLWVKEIFRKLRGGVKALVVLHISGNENEWVVVARSALECGNLLPLFTAQPRCGAQQPTGLRPAGGATPWHAGSAETKAQTGLRTPKPPAE